MEPLMPIKTECRLDINVHQYVQRLLFLNKLYGDCGG